jgi:hypothetical protein
MTLPRVIVLHGRAYRWKDLLELRKQQAVPEPPQPTLFELREDKRPEPARTAAGRYLEPGLFDPR